MSYDTVIISGNYTTDEFSKEFRKKPFLRKYGTNIMGLISISEYFSNKTSIVSQAASIGYGLDFSWIINYEFFTQYSISLLNHQNI